MRKADLIAKISDKTGITKVDVMITLEDIMEEIIGDIKDEFELKYLLSKERIFIYVGLVVLLLKKELLKLVEISKKILP